MRVRRITTRSNLNTSGFKNKDTKRTEMKNILSFLNEVKRRSKDGHVLRPSSNPKERIFGVMDHTANEWLKIRVISTKKTAFDLDDESRTILQKLISSAEGRQALFKHN